MRSLRRWNRPSRVVAVSVLLGAMAMGNETLAWGPDVLVKDEVGQTDVSPALVTTSTKGYFMVRDNLENDCMDILRSTDNGRHWTQFFWYCGGVGNEITSPAVAVPEIKEDYLYVVFVSGAKAIRLLTVDLKNPGSWTVRTVAEHPNGMADPSIVTDNHDFTEYYVYVAYQSISEGDVGGQVYSTVSIDGGATWGRVVSHHVNIFAGQWAPRIAYGNRKLYMAWIEPRFDPYMNNIDEIHAHVSLDSGASWSTPRALYGQGGSFTIARPRIAATHGADAVITAWNCDLPFPSDRQDIWYAFSDSLGDDWSSTRLYLHNNTNVGAQHLADLAVDPALGSFHLLYFNNREEGCVWECAKDLYYTSVPFDQTLGADAWWWPGPWTPPIRVNDGPIHSATEASLAIDRDARVPVVAWRQDNAGIYADTGFAPDLEVTSILLNPTAPKAGQQVEVTVGISNKGVWDAGGFSLAFYRDLAPGVLPNPPGDAITFACSFAGLARGASATCTQTIAYPKPGAFAAWAFVDSDRTVIESDENNNAFGPVPVTVAPGVRAVISPQGVYDGSILESRENSSRGGNVDVLGKIFGVGDDGSNRQARGVLSFNTSGLPNNAVITAAALRLKSTGVLGTNPFRTHGDLLVDIRSGAFSSRPALQISDFEAPASLLGAGRVGRAAVAGWHWATLRPEAFRFVNRTGLTQFRLRFAMDDNNDRGTDAIFFASGDARVVDRPVLLVDYFVP